MKIDMALKDLMALSVSKTQTKTGLSEERVRA
jgi:hypothetical protein